MSCLMLWHRTTTAPAFQVKTWALLLLFTCCANHMKIEAGVSSSSSTKKQSFPHACHPAVSPLCYCMCCDTAVVLHEQHCHQQLSQHLQLEFRPLPCTPGQVEPHVWHVTDDGCENGMNEKNVAGMDICITSYCWVLLVQMLLVNKRIWFGL